MSIVVDHLRGCSDFVWHRLHPLLLPYRERLGLELVWPKPSGVGWRFRFNLGEGGETAAVVDVVPGGDSRLLLYAADGVPSVTVAPTPSSDVRDAFDEAGAAFAPALAAHLNERTRR